MTEWNETAPGTKRPVLGRTPLTAYLRDTHAVRVIGMEGGLLTGIFSIKQINTHTSMSFGARIWGLSCSLGKGGRFYTKSHSGWKAKSESEKNFLVVGRVPDSAGTRDRSP